MKEFWNERYLQEEFAYGEEANNYFKEKIATLKPGKILLPAEGEGRNAVYAAKLGWDVYAFDISEEGKNKALKLAKENNVSINYLIGELPDLALKNEYFDVIALIFAHFPPNIKSKYHKLLGEKLSKDGIVIFEAFSKNHLKYKNENPKVGGPSNIDSLFSIEEIKSDFKNYKELELTIKDIELEEGLYHNGKSSVARFVGKKQ